MQGSHRALQLLETSVARVFALGDVRSHSAKRVASAVGEGVRCVQLVHRRVAVLDQSRGVQACALYLMHSPAEPLLVAATRKARSHISAEDRSPALTSHIR